MPLELKDIPEPIGNFILEQKDVKPLMLPDGAYYHYSHVCVMLKKILTSRFASIPPTTEEAELWMDVIDIVIKTDGPAIPLLQDEYSIRRRSEQNSEAIEFSKEKVTELVTLAYKEGFSRNGRPLGEWGDHYNENEAELKEYIDQLFKQKQREPEPATPGQWYARLEGCKTPEDVDELEKRHVDVINANPDLRRLFVIYKFRLKNK